MMSWKYVAEKGHGLFICYLQQSIPEFVWRTTVKSLKTSIKLMGFVTRIEHVTYRKRGKNANHLTARFYFLVCLDASSLPLSLLNMI
jgi:hypothetical protein